MTGTFIADRQGQLVEVTDYEAALKQARMGCLIDQGGINFPESHANWKHILLELEKLALKNPNLLKP